MPSFNLSVTPFVKNRPLSIRLYGYDKKERSLTIAPTPATTLGTVSTLVDAVANCSNMGLIAWSWDGTTRCIDYGNVSVIDDAHDSGSTLRIVFQNSTGGERILSIPAPKASMFSNGVYLDVISVGTPQQALINAALDFLNNTAEPAEDYAFVGGVLNTASKLEKRATPNIIDEA